MQERLPNLSQWRLDNDENGVLAQYWRIERILRPSLFPSYTFITEDFRYSIRLPETFDAALKKYARSAKNPTHPDAVWVYMGIALEAGKVALVSSVATYDSLTQDQIDSGMWATITDFQTWLLLRYEEDFKNSFSGPVNTDEFLKSFGVSQTIVPPAQNARGKKARQTGKS